MTAPRTPRPARRPGPFTRPRPSPLRWVTRAVARHRRTVAALAAGLAAACVVSAISPPPLATRTVVVAARPITAGAAVVADDLTVARYPVGLAPSDAVGDPATLVGRPSVAALGAGTPVTHALVVSPDALRAAPGRSLVPVRLADPGMARLVRSGDRVDVLALPTDGGAAERVARAARVAAIPGGGGSAGPLGGDDTASATVVFDVADEVAPRLAHAAATAKLTLVLRGP